MAWLSWAGYGGCMVAMRRQIVGAASAGGRAAKRQAVLRVPSSMSNPMRWTLKAEVCSLAAKGENNA